jgi:hypothetical protein
MMMGEFEYGELFPEDDKMPLRLKGTSRIIFLAFVVLSSIVLMNLMVGLAVNDIQVICLVTSYHATLTLHSRLRS